MNACKPEISCLYPSPVTQALTLAMELAPEPPFFFVFSMADDTQPPKQTGTVATRLDQRTMDEFVALAQQGGYLNKGDALRDAVRLWVQHQKQKQQQAA